MSRRRGTAGRLGMATAGALLTLMVAAAGFEVVSHVRYRRWRASFDNEGWIGRLTVASKDKALLVGVPPYGDVQGVATTSPRPRSATCWTCGT